MSWKSSKSVPPASLRSLSAGVPPGPVARGLEGNRLLARAARPARLAHELLVGLPRIQPVRALGANRGLVCLPELDLYGDIRLQDAHHQLLRQVVPGWPPPLEGQAGKASGRSTSLK